MLRWTTRWGLALLAGTWLASAAAADLADDWKQTLAKTGEHLEAGEFRKAETRMQSLLRQMGQRLGAGDHAAAFVAQAVLYRALAEEGLGRSDDAVWHWHAAVAIHPPIEKLDLSRFGAPGEYLRGQPPPETEEKASSDDAEQDDTHEQDLEPPRVVKFPIEYPEGAESLGWKGRLVVSMIIGDDGRISHPKVLEPLPAPMLTYAALEGVRRWRFTPAKRDGEPVASWYNLTLHYGRPTPP